LKYFNEWFQKISIPTPWMVIRNSESGGGVSKAKIFKEKYEAKLEFPEGRGGGEGLQSKKPSSGEAWIFSGTTQYKIHVSF